MLDAEYTPEQASQICEAHPDTIRMLARKVAAGRTRISLGMSAAKYYHGGSAAGTPSCSTACRR
jgi:anaerobic selenocysteine-containing dehydrogenase